jgi:hypothetical protein
MSFAFHCGISAPARLYRLVKKTRITLSYPSDLAVRPATKCLSAWPKPWLMLALICCCLPAAAQSIPHSSHVVLVIEENHQYSDVLAQMSWLTSMGNQYGYATNYEADTSGSLMDYLWLSSGSCESSSCAPSPVPPGSGNFGCAGDHCSSPITDDNIFRILTNSGISWKEYMESYTGWNGPDNSLYVKRHNPAAWYSDVINSQALQSKIVDFGSNFLRDANANSLPNYSIVVPNMQDDAHDGSLGQADVWLQNNIAPILNTPPFQAGGDGLLIITFDECDAAGSGICSDGTEHVYTAVIGPQVVPHTASNTHYMHENTLRTILQALGANDFPLASGTASPMSDFFSTSPSATMVSPADGSTVSGTITISASINGSYASVLFWRDNWIQIGQNSSPQLLYDTTALTGSHQFFVSVLDSAGNTLCASNIVTVNVGSTTVTMLSPADGSTVSGTITISASISSSYASVVFWRDNWIQIGQNSSPQLSYNTGALTDGNHQFFVSALDSAGNTLAASNIVTANVQNGPATPLAGNFDDIQTGWQLCTGPGCAGGTGNPTSTSQTFMNASPSLDGSSMLLSLSGPQFSNNAWLLNTGPQDSDTSFTLDLWFNVPSNADVQAVEFDMFQYLLAGHGGATANTRLFFATECLPGGVWNVWDSSGRDWISTGAPCSYIVSSTEFNHLVIAVHRVSGDTSCGGFPCMFYDSITLNGTVVVSNVKTNAGALPAGWSEQTGIFLQLDTNSACGSGCTINEYIDKGNFFAN